MLNQLVFAAIAGYCGNDRYYELLRRLRNAFGGVPGYQFDPQFPWPPNCPVCGVVGSIVGGIILYSLSNQFLMDGKGLDLASTLATGFIGGRLGSQIANEIGGRLKV